MSDPKPGDVVVERRHKEAVIQALRPHFPIYTDSDDSWLVRDLALALATIEHNARPKWTACSVELPDSDIRVLIRDVAGEVMTAELEFTDDSEGHGEPYWAAEGGDLALCNYPHWKPLPEPPKEPSR